MFKTLKKAMSEAFSLLIKNQTSLFITDVDKELLWTTYLNSFEDAIIKQEYNCNSCRQFIKNYGGVVAIKDNKLVTIWDFVGVDVFDKSIKNLHKLVAKSSIRDIFFNDIPKMGNDFTLQRFTKGEDGKQVLLSAPITWNHFSLVLPKIFVQKGELIPSVQGAARDNKNVFKRSLDEITQDSVETVLELIAQNSLYRGEESKGVLTEFLKHKKAYTKVAIALQDNYCWVNSKSGAVSKIRNTSIGTLLVDISEGKELDHAVSAFERVVAPSNYKRPTSLITKRMIEDAEKTIKELGYEESLARRFAVSEDVAIENVLFINRDAKKLAGVFNELKEDVTINPKSLTKLEEITIDNFIEKILPDVKGVQFLFENSQLNNLMSLITCENKEAPNLLKWPNPFSWSYTNAVTDSIKENVKSAGGKVDGVLRFSIQWNEDGKSIIDLDAHAHEPEGAHIYFSSIYRKDRGGNTARTYMTGQLDVDMISPRTIGVENIAWSDISKMKEGKYRLRVHNFSGHRNFDGVRAEIEAEGQIYEFAVNKAFGDFIDIAEVNYSKTKGFTVKSSLDTKSSVLTKDKWGISTNKFHKVKMIMNSPNFWNGNIGNKHTFFILEGAINDESPRGFFNEFLKDELTKNKKVFEVLGGKLKVSQNDKQLSGLGFSSTQRTSIICKVEGKFDRTLKITI